MFGIKKRKVKGEVSESVKSEQMIEQYLFLFDNYRNGDRDEASVELMVTLAYNLTLEMPRKVVGLFCDKYDFYFKRSDGTVFSAVDVLDGKAIVNDVNLEKTVKWLLE